MSWDAAHPRLTYDPMVDHAIGAWAYRHDEWDLAAPTHTLTGEQRLAFAVLFDAIVTLKHGAPRCVPKREKASRLLEHEATRQWLVSDADHPFSLVWCCQALGADPDAIRLAITTKRGRRQRQFSSYSAR